MLQLWSLPDINADNAIVIFLIPEIVSKLIFKFLGVFIKLFEGLIILKIISYMVCKPVPIFELSIVIFELKVEQEKLHVTSFNCTLL